MMEELLLLSVLALLKRKKYNVIEVLDIQGGQERGFLEERACPISNYYVNYVMNLKPGGII